METDSTKGRDVQKHHDPFSGIITGVLFVIAGALIFADKLDILEGGWFWWLIFAYGIILIGESVYRLSVPRYSRPVGGRLIWGAILVAFSASQIYELENWWPLILIAAGVAMIVNSVVSRKRVSEHV